MFYSSVEGQLWRGVREDLSEIYPKGEFQIWWSFSSCTSSLEVFQQPQFVGKSGIRTLFCIEGTTTGKNISRHSYFKKEDEILLLPGTSLQVRSLIHRADGFHVVHLRQVKPPYELLVSPFDDSPLEFDSSISQKTSIQPCSNLNRTFKSKQYDSADETPNSSYQNLKFTRNIDKHSDISGSSSIKSSKVISSVHSSLNTKSKSNRIPKLQIQKSTKGKSFYNTIYHDFNYKMLCFFFSSEHIEINYVDRLGNYIVVRTKMIKI